MKKIRKVLVGVIIGLLMVGIIITLLTGEVSVLGFVFVAYMAIICLSVAECFIEIYEDPEDETEEDIED